MTKQRKSKLSRRDIVRTDSGLTAEALAKKIATLRGSSSVRESSARLSKLESAERVFQHRLIDESVAESERHILELTRALKEQGQPLEPLLVLPAGKSYIVIDGHHRLAAYRTAAWTKLIPIDIFIGTVEEARDEALKRNSRNKLEMTSASKAESAWQMVLGSKKSIKQISELSTVSPRTVSNMRKVRAVLAKRGDVSELSWSDARRAMTGKEVPNADDWRGREADKIVKALLNAGIGQGLTKNPDVTALALRRLNARLPSLLIKEWGHEEASAIREIAEELPAEGKTYEF
jgi:hypothetical protein